MNIQKNTVAAITYQVMNASTGTLLQDATAQDQEFLFGHGLLLDVFENNLIGLSEGESFHFEAKAAEAYGAVDPRAIFDMPLSTFAEEDGSVDDEVVQVGHIFPMQDENGYRHYGKIIRKMKDRVTMDFNHPMAGKDLLFSGKVHHIRAARPEEIPHGHQCNCGIDHHPVEPQHKSIFEH